MGLHIVLVEPEIPQNTGNIARTCAALGATLHLVEPLGFSIDEKSVRRAGLDYWNSLDLYTYPSLTAFLQAHGNKELFFFTTKGKKRYCDTTYPQECFLLFGKESAGLPEELLSVNKNRAVRLPMLKDTRSLNLSNTVAIAAYEVQRQWDFKGLESAGDLHHLQYKSEN